MSRPWRGQHLGLAIERQMPGVFGDQHVGDHRLGRQPALDQPFGRRRLDDRLLAGPAGVFGPMRHDHPELRRDHVEPLGGVLADHMHGRRGSTGSWCLRARSSHARAADEPGSAPRLARRLSARARAAAGSFLSSAASLAATACSISSSARASWSGSSFSERRPNCMRCSWRSRCCRRSILRQRLVALRNRGVPLRERRRQPRLQRCDVGWRLIRDLAHVRHGIRFARACDAQSAA